MSIRVRPVEVYGADNQGAFIQSEVVQRWAKEHGFKVIGFRPVTPGCLYVNYIDPNHVATSRYTGMALSPEAIKQWGNWRIILEPTGDPLF